MARIIEDRYLYKPLKLYSRAEIASMNPRQYREYEASLKAYRDAYSIAKTERNSRNLKSMGMTAEQIAAVTKLPVDEIESL